MIYVPWWSAPLLAGVAIALAVLGTYWGLWWAWQPSHGRHTYGHSHMRDTVTSPAAEADTEIIVARVTDLGAQGADDRWADELHRMRDEIKAEPRAAVPLPVFFQEEEEWFRRTREMALGQRQLVLADSGEMDRI